MSRLDFFVVFALLWLPGLAQGDSPIDTRLSKQELGWLNQKISRFYREPRLSQKRGGVLDEALPKFSPSTGRRVESKLFGQSVSSSDPLVKSAGSKASPAYKKHQCEHFWRRFPGLECENRLDETVTASDDVSELSRTWIAKEKLARKMEDLPRRGKIQNEFWSGDYWRTQWGLTSYRFADGEKYETYEAAVGAYQQPADWKSLIPQLGTTQAAKTLNAWSPSEKYDLTVGSEKFILTNEQKKEGESLIGENGKIEDWFGLCHGWAPAAILSPAPVKPVKSIGARETKIAWHPHDIRALVSLAWSNGDYHTTFVGSRCETEKPRRHANGRLKNEDCFDTNPATLHLALANMLGKHGQGFIIDASFDSEISNQPVLSYEFKFFNPLNPDELEEDWQKAVVPYDETFKRQDRFQSPLTRGRRKGNQYHDDKIKSIVGVAATVVYLDETDATTAHEEIPNETMRVTYTYDLELEERGGELVPTGGEWHSNLHPDFLWMVEKNSFPHLKEDEMAGVFSLQEVAGDGFTKAAEKAAKSESYPLCSIVKALVEASSGQSYACE